MLAADALLVGLITDSLHLIAQIEACYIAVVLTRSIETERGQLGSPSTKPVNSLVHAAEVIAVHASHITSLRTR